MYHTTINLSRNGRHFFRVELGRDGASDGSADNVRSVFEALTLAFPDCKVTASRKSNMATEFNPVAEA